MLDFDTILVSVDLAHGSTRVMDWGGYLAAPCGASVHVLHVLSVPTHDPVRALFHEFADRGETEEAIRERITEHVESSQLADQAHPVKRVHRRGADEAAEILHYADEIGVDLIVMGSRGRRELQHPALGGTTGEVLRRAACPVLTVPLHKDRYTEEADHRRSIKHVLAPIDFSEHAERAVPVARELAGLFGASLSLLFVAEERTVVTFNDTGLPGFQTLKTDEEITRRAGEALSDLYQQAERDQAASPDVEASFQVRHGRPARQIVQFAEEQDVDLILQSARGTGGHALFDLGTVAERVVRRASCPVFTLKAGGGY